MRAKLTKREQRVVYSRHRVQQVCYHEAGHAVAALLLGLGLKGKVKIRTHDRGTRRFGVRTIWPGFVVTEHKGTHQSAGIFITAGWTAERHFYSRTSGYDYLRQDIDLFMEVMGVRGDDYLRLWQEYCEGTTLEFVKKNCKRLSNTPFRRQGCVVKWLDE